MRTGARLLILDEPTNDLDLRSIEVLKCALVDFPGAVVLITHYRHMLDRVCTDIIGLYGDGGWGNYGSVAQWQEAEARGMEPDLPSIKGTQSRSQTVRPKRAGLTYLEKREWEGMEERIFAAEEEVNRLQAELENSEVVSDHERLQQVYEVHGKAQQRLASLFNRWEELEQKMMGK